MCPHDRVVRLYVKSELREYWICTQCNAQFIPKASVDWKIAHLTKELQKLVCEGTVTYEQVARVWKQEDIQE